MIICDECETVAHCTKHGCIPKQPLGCVNHDCAKCKATPAPVQEPIKPDTLSLEQLLRAAVYWGATYAKGDYHDALEGKIYQWISLRSGATPPAAQRSWVGLTDEEYEKAIRDNMLLQMNFAGIRDDIEAKLREKNGGQA